MPKEISYFVNTPGGVQAKNIVVPDEGEFFTTTKQWGTYDLFKVENGKMKRITPSEYYKTKYNLTGRESYDELKKLGLTDMTNIQYNHKFFDELGIDKDKLPNYNIGIISEYFPRQEEVMSGNDIANLDVSKINQGTGKDLSTSWSSSEDRPYTDEERIAIFGDKADDVTNTGQGMRTNNLTYGQPLQLDNGQVIGPNDPNYDIFARQLGAEKPLESEEKGIKIPSPEYLKDYTEDQIIRDDNGDIYLKPGVEPTFTVQDTQQVSNAQPSIMTDEKGIKVPGPEFLKFYTEDQLIRDPDGTIYLKKGVEPKFNVDQTAVQETVKSAEDQIIDQIVDAVGDPNAGEVEILDAVENLKNKSLDPYYRQLIGQVQEDIVGGINRLYEDRIRQLQSETYNLAENIGNTQKNLEARGLTFSGEAIKQLGKLSAFNQPDDRPEAVTPQQLPEMTMEQMGLEGAVPQQNRLFAETSRTRFNRALEDVRKQAERTLGTEGIEPLGLPQTQGVMRTQPTVGTMQYSYNRDLQNLRSGLANQQEAQTGYQQIFL